MKKSLFKVLCMVLIIALLAPNAFAATPAPEAPLADAATVERVKQEIANGEITDMEDLFLVAYQHLGADLEEEGMTAYINEDGTLGFTQIISSNNSRTRSGEVEEFTFATSTLALIDDNGTVVRGIDYVPGSDSDSKSVNGTSIRIAHIAYYNGRGVLDDPTSQLEVRLNYMVTSITGSGSSHTVTSLRQTYTHSAYEVVDEYDSRIVYNVVNGPYSFQPSQRSWYPVYGHTAVIQTYAEVTISGIADSVTLHTAFYQYNVDGNL